MTVSRTYYNWIPAEERIRQINERPNTTFVRWEGEYKNAHSKAVCRCTIDGHEWVTRLQYRGAGCPQCAGNRRRTAAERIQQINEQPNITFVRWDGDYRNCKSKAICRCNVDGFEWAASVSSLVHNRSGCPRCGVAIVANTRRIPAEEIIAKINELPNISFVRWESGYTNSRSKAVCRCGIDGFEWATKGSHLFGVGSGCPACAQGGFNPAKQGTLYILRSECGTMVKIGISNNYKQRHTQLERATPFDWHCIELLHSDDGSLIAEWEKELHSMTEQAEFKESFDGYTEWRKWDPRLLKWLKRYRARLERYNKAP